MLTKLTLSIHSKTVAKAKKYAKKKGISVSKLFEEQITELTHRDQVQESDPLMSLRKLKGIAKGIEVADESNRDLIGRILIEKHLK